MVVVAVALGLCYRLVFWQVMDRHALVSEAMAQRSGGARIAAPRGLILDDQGNPLAVDDQTYQVYASPNQIFRPDAEARLLAPLLHEKTSYVANILGSKITYPRLALSVSQSTANRIQKLAETTTLQGISLQPTPNRVYPEGSLGAQVLGFVDSNGGSYGLEQYYNGMLSGQERLSTFLAGPSESNDVTVPAASQCRTNQPSTARLSIFHLTPTCKTSRKISSRRQSCPREASVARLSSCSQGPAESSPWQTTPTSIRTSQMRRKWALGRIAAISNTYEPGSTFKIFTMAAGLANHAITPYTTIYDPGYAVYPTITVHNWDYPVANGKENMIQVLQHSANVGAAFVANRLGVSRFYPYIRRFGVGQPTGVDLSGEAPGSLPLPGDRVWSISNLYTNAYGQAETMTPLQLINGVNTVANGGLLMRPELVKRIDYRGQTIYRRPAVIRRVISQTTARTLTHMLVTSAINGEASCALVKGYQIAAKTGTANIAGPYGQYLSGPGSTIASTVAWAPAYRPRFSVLVIVRKPVTWPWGSLIAAPVVHYLFQSLFLHYHIPPTLSTPPPVQCALKLAS